MADYVWWVDGNGVPRCDTPDGEVRADCREVERPPDQAFVRFTTRLKADRALADDVRKARRFDEAEKLILRLDTLTDRKKIDYGLVAALVKLWEGGE